LNARQTTSGGGVPGTSYAEFLERYPAYAATAEADALRAREFSRLDRLGHVYLDYTGGGLHGESQVRGHAEFLLGTVLGNPHSTNPTSMVAFAVRTGMYSSARGIPSARGTSCSSASTITTR
jgi:hypothetical protein